MYPEFGHIGFKFICSVFMFNVVGHLSRKEDYMRMKLEMMQKYVFALASASETVNS